MAALQPQSPTRRFGRFAAVDLTLIIDHGLLVDPGAGTIRVGGRTISAPRCSQPLECRSMSTIAQSYALWRMSRSFENIAYGLALRRIGKAELDRGTSTLLEGTTADTKVMSAKRWG